MPILRQSVLVTGSFTFLSVFSSFVSCFLDVFCYWIFYNIFVFRVVSDCADDDDDTAPGFVDGAAVDAVDDDDDDKNGTISITLWPRFFQLCLLSYLMSVEYQSEQARLFLFVVVG